MAWVKSIEEHEAGKELQGIYEQIKSFKGRLGILYKVRGLLHETMTSQFELYRTLMFGKRGISRVQREMVVVVVSSLNRCHY